MAQDRIGVGIIGANVRYGWGTRAHIPALRALPEFELVAVCTRSAETARSTAEQFDIPHALDDVEALVVHPDVDLVLTCVRVPSHFELTERALRAGKHVFTEWPLGRTLEEATALSDLARERGVRHMVGLQARAAPELVELRGLIADGYIGRPLSATMHSALAGAGPRRSRNVWSADASQGAHTLTIAGGHSLDALAFCLGEFSSLSAHVATQVTAVPVTDTGETLAVTAPDHVLIEGELAGGVLASVSIKSLPAHGTGFRFEVHGTDGMLEVTSDGMAQIGTLTLRGARASDDAVAELPLGDAARWVPAELAGPPLNVAQLFRRLGEGIREGASVDPDFDHAVRRHELLETVRRAAESGQRQTL